MKNEFIIDLSVVDLTEEQRLAIQIALHKAVSAELAKLDSKEKVTLIPLDPAKGLGGDGGFGGGTMGYRGKF